MGARQGKDKSEDLQTLPVDKVLSAALFPKEIAKM